MARVDVIDVNGRWVACALEELLPAGTHLAVWNGRDAGGRPVAPGVYFAHLACEAGDAQRKFLLTR
jgi:hypothetical protein